jgi:hypothetical protein
LLLWLGFPVDIVAAIFAGCDRDGSHGERRMSAIRTAAFVCLFCCASAVSYAAPVTYDFAATLNSPIDGSNQVSGSFSFFSNTPGVQVGTTLELSSPNPATLSFANQSITAGADPMANQIKLVDLGSSDTFSVAAQFQNGVKTVELNLDVIDPTGKALGQSSFEEIPPLNLLDWSQHTISITMTPGEQVDGTLTSLEQAPTQVAPVPEPGTLVVFAVVGGGVLAHRLQRAARPRGA